MFVIITEAVPPRLRGYLSRWLLQVRAGVFVGSYSVKVRKKLWDVVCEELEDGNAVMVWGAQNDSGLDLVTAGKNARKPLEVEGITLVTFTPELQE